MCKYCDEFMEKHEKYYNELDKKWVLKISESSYYSYPKCAFTPLGNYNKDNWECQTMVKLRQLEDHHDWNDDESIGIVKISNGYLVMTYYKGRGRTGNAMIMCDDEMRELTLNDAYRILEER